MKRQIILLCGAKGSGKNTLADLLHEMIPGNTISTAYADPLYAEVAEAFGIAESDLRARHTKETEVYWLALSRCSNKEYVSMMLDLGFGPYQPMSPRHILETWGTEYRRIKSGNQLYWVDRCLEQVNGWLQDRYGTVIITDLRFPDTEYGQVRERFQHMADIIVFKVIRSADEYADADGHASRKPIPDEIVTAEIFNEEGNAIGMAKQVYGYLGNPTLTMASAVKPTEHHNE